MGKPSQDRGKHTVETDGLSLDDLKEGYVGSITVMVCRKWDVNNIHGRYMSTDFIVSDKKGNSMHCVARNNIAHIFLDKLVEGGVVSLKGFTVQRNRDEYRVLKDSPYMIELQGDTVVRKAADDVASFERYPFKFTSFEDLKPTNNKYFVDVIGYVTGMGEPLIRSNGSQTLEFSLTNERKCQVRVTLWGALGNEIMQKKEEHDAIYCVILTSMSAKYYLGNLCLSSSSSTILIDGDDIPALSAFKSSLSCVRIDDDVVPVTQTMITVGTIEELLRRSRPGKEKETVVFRNTVEITNVRTKNSWFNFTCTTGKCRKGVTRDNGRFRCKGCNIDVAYPRARFRVQLDVSDNTMSTVVVLFDETAEALVQRTAKSLLEEQNQDDSANATNLPPALEALVGTKHVFEIKSITYYHYGEYESFNCAKVVLPVMDEGDFKSASGSKQANIKEAATSRVVKNNVTIPTPAKKSERTKRKLYVLDSDAEESAGVGENVSPQRLSLKKRLIESLDEPDETLEDVSSTYEVDDTENEE